MSNLEALKERLKHKPEVRPNEGVRVILAPLSSEEQIEKIGKSEKQTMITVDKDDGKRAQEILEKIKQNKLSNVIKKIAEEPKVEIVSKAPEKEKEKVKKPKKLQKDTIVLVEEQEKMPIDEPKERGEQEQREQQQKGEEGEQEEEMIIKPRKRSTKKVQKGVIELGPEHMIKIGDTRLEKRLPHIPVFDMKVSSYYMNNI